MAMNNQMCYFRTSSENGYYKALLQITDRCNMKCKHCFVDSCSTGKDMSYDNFLFYVLPLLKANKTSKVTLTGGEPTLNEDLFNIVAILTESNIEVALCTNGLNITENLLINLSNLDQNKKIHFNVSLDSFNEKGYSNFRGVNNVFAIIKRNIEMIAHYGYLKGILCTPNSFNSIDDYIKIVEFTKNLGGKYVLFNPIAKLGRGEVNHSKFGVSEEFLCKIYTSTQNLVTDNFDITYVRFPLETHHTNPNCIANNLMYIYVNGDIVRCPYISFNNMNFNQTDSNSFNRLGNIYIDDQGIIIDKIATKSMKEFACKELDI